MGAYTVPVDTMVWLGTVFLVAAMVIAFVVSGARAAEPMEKLLAAETAESLNTPEAEGDSPLAISTHR